ncbi:MAG: DUF5063 domain-containing protein, partial [Sandaracinus sp.]|nr:DUF5063 domain-containing protein [Sandaracinus sp.]
MDPAVVTFADEARSYCAFIEHAVELDVERRLAMARMHLLRLYQAALALPEVEPPDDVDAGPSPERPRGWAGFGDLDGYWEVFDPYEQDEPVGGSLSDDLLDVYADVRRGLDLWDRDVP